MRAASARAPQPMTTTSTDCAMVSGLSALEQDAMKLEITIDVDDLERAVEFYCEGLGLALVERTSDWARVELNGQTFWICLFEAGPHGPISRDFRRHWTPVHFDFIVDDVDKAVERALAAGGHLDREIKRNEPEPIGCHSDVANLSDPAGNGVDLLQRHPASPGIIVEDEAGGVPHVAEVAELLKLRSPR